MGIETGRLATGRSFLLEVYRGWSSARPDLMAAALAYFAMFSLVPMIFIALTVASMFLDQPATAAMLFARFERTLGTEVALFLRDLVIDLAERTRTGRLLPSLIGFVTLLYAASGLFGFLRYALNTIWDAPPPHEHGVIVFVKNRLLAFVMVIGVSLVLILNNMLSTLIPILDAFIEFTPPVPFLNAIGTFVITTASFALLYKILPNVDVAWRDVWVGAAVTALLFALGRNVLGFYLSRIDVGSAFEAAGALAVTLIAIYYLAQIFLLGALLTKVYASMFGSKRGVPIE